MKPIKKEIRGILEKYGIDNYNWKPEIAKELTALFEEKCRERRAREVRAKITKLEQELSALKEVEAEKEVSDENDFVQYVTNLLYNAYTDGKQHISSDVFDEWVEKEMENMSEFYASHNLLTSKVTDEKTIIKLFATYWNSTTDKDNVSHIYDSSIERFININPKYRKSLMNNLIKKG